MDKLFLAVVNMSITGTFVIAAICLVRLPLKKAPKIISYCLWAAAGFRLVIPFSVESVFSLMPVNPQVIAHDTAAQAVPDIGSALTSADNIAGGTLTAADAGAGINLLQALIVAGAYVWFAGVAVMSVYGILSYTALKRRMKGAVNEGSNIFRSENIQSPFVLGIFSPKIYLPPGLDVRERWFVILHEQTHIRRYDHIIKFGAYFILCMHWFNPFAWAAFLLMGADMELSCDERVMKETGGSIKKEYSLSLLSLAAEKRIIGGSPLAFGEGGVKERVKRVLNFKRRSKVMSLVTVVLALMFSISCATNRVTGEEIQTEPTQVESEKYTWSESINLASETQSEYIDKLVETIQKQTLIQQTLTEKTLSEFRVIEELIFTLGFADTQYFMVSGKESAASVLIHVSEDFDDSVIDVIVEILLKSVQSLTKDNILITNQHADVLFPRTDTDDTESGHDSPLSESGDAEYIVKAGDTLSRIAMYLYGDKDKWELIREYNNLAGYGLTVGQKLLIPGLAYAPDEKTDQHADVLFPRMDADADDTESGHDSPLSESGDAEYIVKSGDTLSRIAMYLYGDKDKWELIREYNNLAGYGLTVGQKLLIPGLAYAPDEKTDSAHVREYTVERGDTFASIAKRFYGDYSMWVEIRDFNKITSDLLYIGQKLLIP